MIGRLFLIGLAAAAIMLCAMAALLLVRSERFSKDRLTQSERAGDEDFYLHKFVFNYTDAGGVYHRVYLQRHEDRPGVLCRRTDGNTERETDECEEEILDSLLEIVERNGLSTRKELSGEDSRIRYSYGSGEKHDIGLKANRRSGKKIISEVEAVLDKIEYDE